MKFSHIFNMLSVRRAFAILVALAMAGTVFAQGTTSAIRVNVIDAGGSPVGGVQVAITHAPTGRTQIAASNPAGFVDARGLAIGGPYEVSVIGGGNYAADVMQNIYVDLDQTTVVDLAWLLGILPAAAEEIMEEWLEP